MENNKPFAIDRGFDFYSKVSGSPGAQIPGGKMVDAVRRFPQGNPAKSLGLYTNIIHELFAIHVGDAYNFHMARSSRLIVILYLMALLIGCAGEGPPPRDFHKDIKNVIIIVADTLRAYDLGYMGYNRPTSPFLDEFSKRCVVFDRPYTPKSRTLPAFTSLFSGLHAVRHKVDNNDEAVPDEIHMLTEDFREAGFHTAGFPASVVLAKKSRINRGFDTYDEIKKGYAQIPGSDILKKVKAFLDRYSNQEDTSPEEQKPPLFLFVHFFDTHTPYTPKEVYKRQFADPGYRGPFDGQLLPTIKDYMNGKLDFNEVDLKHALDLYDAEIRELDDYIKELFDMFEEAGLMENSLIIFTADHGENLGEHHHFTHRHPYEQSLLITLMFHFPGDSGAGTRVYPLVELTDLMPTVMDIVGLPVKEMLDGESLLPLIKGEKLPNGNRRYLLARGIENSEGVFAYSLFDGTYRLMKDIFWSEELVLYNIAEDKFETNDIAAENPILVEIMEAILENMIAELEEKDETSVKSVKQYLDPESEEMLRSLGYLN